MVFHYLHVLIDFIIDMLSKRMHVLIEIHGFVGLERVAACGRWGRPSGSRVAGSGAVSAGGSCSQTGTLRPAFPAPPGAVRGPPPAVATLASWRGGLKSWEGRWVGGVSPCSG